MSNITIKMFLKFGNEQNLRDLLHNGTIYMNSIQRFREIEDNKVRGDKYEGIISVHNLPSGQFEIPSIGYKGNYMSMHFSKAFSEIFGNIYSLYCISPQGWPNPLDFKIDPKMGGFGSHCLMIKDNVKFFKLIEENLQKQNLKYHHGFVEYYDENTVNRKIHLFEKPLDFEYQKEFRFYVERESTEPLIFQIGSLEKIAEIYDSKTIIKELKLTPIQQ